MNALLKHKIKIVLPMLIYGGLVTIASVVLAFVQIFQYSIYETSFTTLYMDRFAYSFSFVPIALVPMAVAMGMILTQEYGNMEQEDFLAGLPYKRNSRFLISILPGVVFFLAYWIIVSIAVIISHTISRGEFGEIYLLSSSYESIMKMDGLGNALLRVTQIVTTLISLFFITVFASVSSRNVIVTIAVMICIPICPLFITNALDEVINIKDVSLINDWVNYTSLSGLFEGAVYGKVSDVIYVYYEYSLARTIVSVISTVVWCILGYYYATKSDRIYGKFVVTKSLEKIFMIMTGIYAACMSVFISVSFDIGSEIKLIIMCIVFVVTEIVLYKIITDKGKYSFLNVGGGKK